MGHHHAEWASGVFEGTGASTGHSQARLTDLQTLPGKRHDFLELFGLRERGGVHDNRILGGKSLSGVTRVPPRDSLGLISDSLSL